MHFEILVNDPAKAMKFYGDVFGWKFEDYSQYVNTEYWGVVSGDESTPGINGGLMKRDKPLSAEGTSPRAFVCTIEVENYDDAHAKNYDFRWQGAYSQTRAPEWPGKVIIWTPTVTNSAFTRQTKTRTNF